MNNNNALNQASNGGALRRELTIVNKRGLHARASAKFVAAVAELPEGLDVRVEKDGNSATGGSILGLMMLGAARGDVIAVMVEGEDAEAAMTVLCDLVESGFDED